jgi:flavin reductase (DIM6/NTAB) family NADH-FMN oxidoreductase RutF
MDKMELSKMPASMKSLDYYGFSWIEFVTAIPSPLFVVTTYKSNGKPNATLQSWATFSSLDENMAVCVLASVNKNKHMYKSIKEKGDLVINIPSIEIYDKCTKTIQNNDFDDDEITKSGLTVEKAGMVNAPMIKECFLNLECKYLWEKEIKEGQNIVMCVEIVNVKMDKEHYNENKKGRYGKNGYLYNINNPINPESGEIIGDAIGYLEKMK